MKNQHYVRGGEGSHWPGCHESHWDCKIAYLQGLVDRLPKTEDNYPIVPGMRLFQLFKYSNGWSEPIQTSVVVGFHLMDNDVYSLSFEDGKSHIVAVVVGTKLFADRDRANLFRKRGE